MAYLVSKITPLLKIKVCNFNSYRLVRVVHTGPSGCRYAGRPLLGGFAKKSIVGGRFRSSAVDGRLREKSIVAGRLSEKKGRRRRRRRRRGKEEKKKRGEKERIPSARGRWRLFSRSGRKIEATTRAIHVLIVNRTSPYCPYHTDSGETANGD
ncbi:hypothetical protein BHE74_00002303 [Ensete ventricosum]|nr:hypothetical protein BHE74_00002303 [Ensete ventricosum]